MENLVKQDISFLEYSLWMQDERAEPGLTWTDRRGFIYRTSYKPPVKTDMIFLYYLLLRSQQEGWNDELELTQYEILKGCGIQPGKRWRERLQDSLKRWSAIFIEFEGTFCDGHTYASMFFHIIDSWEIREDDKKLRIEIAKNWLTRIKDSNFFKYLDFEQLKKLRSSLALRLYELLIKTFQTRTDWSCGAKKLAAKIPMNEKYPADIIPKIKAAVNRINENTELQIQLTIRRPKRGQAIFDFEKLDKALQEEKEDSAKGAGKPRVVDVPPEMQRSLQELIKLMPPEHQGKKTIRDAAARFLCKHGVDYVRQNILYANKHATSNYRTYLSRALKEDWGVGFLEEVQEAQEQKQVEKVKVQRKRDEEKEQERIQKQAHGQLLSMTQEQQAQLEEEARAGLDTNLLNSPLASSLLKMQMRAILAKRIATQEN